MQPSQSKDSLLFLGLSILLVAIFIPVFLWSLRKRISDMQKSQDFTDRDLMAVRRQTLALLVEVPLVLLLLALSRLVLAQPTPSIFLIGLILGFAPLAYVAISSIRNHVVIGRESLPVKATKAVRSGVISLALIVLMFFTGLVIYFASLK